LAKIILFTQDGLLNREFQEIEHDGSVGEFVAERYFDRYDAGSAIPFSVYEGIPCHENEITDDITRMMAAKEGDFTVVETAGTGIEIAAIIISIVAAVAVIGLAPDPELPQNVARNQESPNNQLSSRSNKARPLERIPDIKGRVKSVPDLAAAPYSTYLNNQEVEHGLYCVGRKQLQIDDLQDGDTPIELISGSTAGIYFPFNSPTIGNPDISINNHQSEPIYSAYRSNQANGILLSTELQDTSVNVSELIFNIFTPDGGPDNMLMAINAELPAAYIEGAEIELENAIANVTGVGNVDVSGLYIITELVFVPTVTFFNIRTSDGSDAPVANNEDGAGVSGIMKIAGAQEFTDWIYQTADLFETAIFNVVAPSGMYRDTGASDLLQRTVNYQFQVEPVDADNNPSGIVDIFSDSISGADQKPKGKTTQYALPYPTRFRMRAKRLTPRGTAANTVYVDEIKLEDVYGLKLETQDDFGDVTLIQTLTRANQFATAIKERQLNCFATEMLNVYEGNGNFALDLTANRSAVQSFITDAIDPVIGNLELDDIDADGILAIESEIVSYFSRAELLQMDYTFDSTNTTFQEYARIMFDAINCIAFRESVVIKAQFEKPQSVPALLFTHRSKKPDAEKYTRQFNQSRINDGVEFNWNDYELGITRTIYLPADRSALNPKVFNIPGIANENQATIRALREFQKIKNAKEAVDVTVTGEGRYAKPNEMISIVKGTRVGTTDGEVLEVDQSGLVLTLSQDVDFNIGNDFSITLKKDDGTTENIGVSQGSQSNEVVLDQLPSFQIRTGIDFQRRTEFSFAEDAVQEQQFWLPQEIDDSDLDYVTIRAINYSDLFYVFDQIGLNAFSDGFSDGFS